MILVTGGTGYIGSHTVVKLLEENYEVLVYDNLSNSKERVIHDIKKIVEGRLYFEQGDIRDFNQLDDLFKKYPIDAVVHFAGLKAVGESVENPLKYYDNNIRGTLTLLKVMKSHQCSKLVFSSSATVYGNNANAPFKEDCDLSTTNPYGATKLMLEDILTDVTKSDPLMATVLLRYFNPIGAHESGLIGENPNDIPNNLLPYVAKVATGEMPFLNVFGSDYPTKDGTGVRDYIHVEDLAVGHIKALKHIDEHGGVHIFNLGTGIGYSVLEVVEAFKKASHRSIPLKFVERRTGDIAACFADVEKSKRVLDWQAHKSLNQMCEDAWRFVLNKEE